MPVSPYHYLNENCALIVREFPTSVLDVGVGHGKWGFLCRDTLEAFVGTRYFKADWKVRIDGIEIFPAYRNPVWEYAYDRVHLGNALDVVPHLDVYDLILAMEVIEHLEKADGQRLVADLVARAVRGVVLSFPDAASADALAQGEVHGNPHERHRSVWSPADLTPYSVEALSTSHVFLRDPAKRRIAASDLRAFADTRAVIREAAKGCGCVSQPWLVLPEPGSRLQLCFDGTRTHVYFVRHAYGGRARVTIDGEEAGEVALSVPGAAEYGCWRSSRLTAGTHVLMIEAGPQPGTGRAEVWLDDVVIEKPPNVDR